MKYPLAPDSETWRGKPLLERQRWLRNAFIPHPRARSAIKHVEHWLERCQTLGRGHGLYVYGETGSGKSRLATYLKEQLSQQQVDFGDDRTIVPVLHIAPPDICTRKQLAVQILSAMGDPLAEKGTYLLLKRRVKKLFKECRVQVVIMDDLQDMLASRTLKGVKDVLILVRDLIDETPTLFVLMGSKESQIILDGNFQLRKRVPLRAYLPYFELTDPARTAEFKKLLAELQKWLPLAETSNLEAGNTAMRLFVATNGIFQFLILLLDLAWPRAVANQRESLHAEDLATAFDSLYGDVAPGANPFRADFALRKLDKEGEPFHGWK